jgi:membrane dipeptidase
MNSSVSGSGKQLGGLIAVWAASMLTCNAVIAATSQDDAIKQRIDRILAATPLIDGHNDLPDVLTEHLLATGSVLDLSVNQSQTNPLPKSNPSGPALMTDIPRLRAGLVGGQFWSAFIDVSVKGPAVVQATIEQIDVIKGLAARYPDTFEMAYTAADVRRIHKAGKVASLIGVEGGHQINDSLAVLRDYYDLGTRYMTLTHSSNTAWADSATDSPVHHGLTPFGKEVVREMNRLGMLVDLSHVSPDTMRAALEVTAAPVIFSHSSARSLVDHPRDVPDDILKLVEQNHGVVMVNFAPPYVSQARDQWEADRAAELSRFNSPPFGGLYIGQPERAKAALTAWEAAHPRPVTTLAQVADHIQHIHDVAGADSVGLGSDFDGIGDAPIGLSGVDCFPALLAELARRGWTDRDLAKLAGENILRVLAAAEATSVQLRKTHRPSDATLAKLDAAGAG